MAKYIIKKSECKNNRDTLIWLMTKHKLSASDVARMLRVNENTVRHWRAVNGKIPQDKLDLLIFKIEVSDE